MCMERVIRILKGVITMAVKFIRTPSLLEKRLKNANGTIAKQKEELLVTQTALAQTYEDNLKLQEQLLSTQEVVVSLVEGGNS